MSNMFKQMEFMPGATLEQLKDKAVECANEICGTICDVPNMTDLVMVSILCTGIVVLWMAGKIVIGIQMGGAYV